MNSTAPDPAAVDEFGAAEPGRPVVLEPTPPGMWRALLGMAVAVLAPLLGFLVGGIFGSRTVGDSIDPMVLSLFIGIIIGGHRATCGALRRSPAVDSFPSEDATEA